MTVKDPSSIWWSEVAGPCSIVDEVVNSLLLDKQNILLSIPDDLPWRNEMRASIETEFRSKARLHDLVFDIIDVKDECPNVDDIARWLFEHYADRDARNGYRDRSGPLTRYMMEHKVLANRLLWVKGINSDKIARWTKFCREYVPSGGVMGGMLVLESTSAGLSTHKRLSVISYCDRITPHDIRLFNSVLLNQAAYRGYSDLWKQYITVLCATLCKDDAEISCRLLDTTDFHTEDPLDSLRSIAQEPEFSRRGANPDHILFQIRSDEKVHLSSMVWSAQLQVVFPNIELKRISFIQDHYTDLAGVLAGHKIMQGPEKYRVRVLDPIDLEVVTLSLLASHTDYWPTGVTLFSSRETILFSHLHKLRNHLAHLECCSPQELSLMFDAN